ncbi:MAG: CRISPR-associated endonuclease Cas3'', partial [bacterium]
MRFKSQNPQPQAPVLPFRECWAKTTASGQPGTSVLEHCRIAGYTAKALCRQLPPSVLKRLGTNPALAAALHDVGKVSPGFQLKYFRRALAARGNPLAKQYGVFDDNHTRVGECTLAAVYGRDGCPPVAQVAGAHHGSRSQTRQNSDLDSLAEGPEWPQERRKLIAALEDEFGQPGEQPKDGLPTMLLAGLVCVADWIASDERIFDSAGLHESANLATLAATAVRQCGWRKPEVRSDLSFQDIFGFEPRPAQGDFSARIAKPGIYVLEAPTGTGKTETALFAAYSLLADQRARGLYFALPTRLTSDRIHQRVEAFLRRVCTSDHAPRLAHGTAWLSRFCLDAGPTDPNTELNADAWFNPLKRALLHPFAVGTVDQALLGVLNVRHFFLRLFGLAGKVVILDEVHTYDLFTGTHLDELVCLLRDLDCTVIVLSATLTNERRRQLLGLPDLPSVCAYPLLSSDNG